MKLLTKSQFNQLIDTFLGDNCETLVLHVKNLYNPMPLVQIVELDTSTFPNFSETNYIYELEEELPNMISEEYDIEVVTKIDCTSDGKVIIINLY